MERGKKKISKTSNKTSKKKIVEKTTRKKIKSEKIVNKKIIIKKIAQKEFPKKITAKPIEKKGFFTSWKDKILGEEEITQKIIPIKKIIPKVSEKGLEDKYIQTGIKGFDALFNNKQGIPKGASVLIEGGPGSGKTIFCLSTVYNLCKEGKKCLYMSFEEPENRLIKHMKKFNWDAEKYVKEDKLRITRFNAIDVSRSIEALLSAAKKELLIDVDPVFFPRDFEPDFVIIDSLTSIASAFSGQESRFRIYMEQLFRYLEKNGITNFLIREVSSPSHIGTTFKEQGEAVSFLSDGIIVMYNVIYDSGNRDFATEILKMRGVDFQKKIVEMKIIDGKGISVNPKKVITKNKKNNFKLT